MFLIVTDIKYKILYTYVSLNQRFVYFEDVRLRIDVQFRIRTNK